MGSVPSSMTAAEARAAGHSDETIVAAGALLAAAKAGDLLSLQVAETAFEIESSREALCRISPSPLVVAAVNGRVDVIKYLVLQPWTALEWRSTGSTTLISEVLDGLDPCSPHTRSTEDNRKQGGGVGGHSALLVAAAAGHADVVAVLVRSGANANAVNANKCSAAYTACRYGHLDVLCTILAAGANLELASIDGDTPLLISVRVMAFFEAEERIEFMKLLLENGADANARNSGGSFALGIAARAKKPGVCRLLIDFGASTSMKMPSCRNMWCGGDCGGGFPVLQLLKKLGLGLGVVVREEEGKDGKTAANGRSFDEADAAAAAAAAEYRAMLGEAKHGEGGVIRILYDDSKLDLGTRVWKSKCQCSTALHRSVLSSADPPNLCTQPTPTCTPGKMSAVFADFVGIEDQGADSTRVFFFDGQGRNTSSELLKRGVPSANHFVAERSVRAHATLAAELPNVAFGDGATTLGAGGAFSTIAFRGYYFDSRALSAFDHVLLAASVFTTDRFGQSGLGTAGNAAGKTICIGFTGTRGITTDSTRASQESVLVACLKLAQPYGYTMEASTEAFEFGGAFAWFVRLVRRSAPWPARTLSDLPPESLLRHTPAHPAGSLAAKHKTPQHVSESSVGGGESSPVAAPPRSSSASQSEPPAFDGNPFKTIAGEAHVFRGEEVGAQKVFMEDLEDLVGAMKVFVLRMEQAIVCGSNVEANDGAKQRVWEKNPTGKKWRAAVGDYLEFLQDLQPPSNISQAALPPPRGVKVDIWWLWITHMQHPAAQV